MSKISERIPVTVITGCLGAGKTTLLNHLLTSDLARDCAVIVNEFGELSIDAQLIVHVEEDVIEINNGCICCTVREDLVQTIKALLARENPIKRILIETTGLADPAPVIQSFMLDETLLAFTRLDAIVTVVDAFHNEAWLAMGARDEAEGRENTAREQIAFADLVLLGKTDLADAAAVARCEAEIRRIAPRVPILQMSDGRLAAERVLDLRAFDLQNALAIEPELLADVAHDHAEDIQSIMVRPRADLDSNVFFRWLNGFVQQRGKDVFRIKGIVAIRGERRRYVFHGVHMTLDGRPGRPWSTEETRSGAIVFIGRGLDADDLQAQVDDCIREPVDV